MYVLGIETSCDETSASLVKDGSKILSNVVASSLNMHTRYGGIVPEIAFRKQLETITAVVDRAVKQARIELKDIKIISVTKGPGLLGSLLVGISFAKAASYSLGVPLLGVNHLYAHIYSGLFNVKKPEFPFVALVVSGGHTSLFYVKDFAKIRLLGSTQDDACGESFDKVAKILGLGYPGGPLIEKLAKHGNSKKIKFSCSGTKGALDFSFSGIKTAVLYYLRDTGYACLPPACRQGRDRQGIRNTLPVTRYPLPLIRDIAASFQEAVIDTLIKKSILACKIKKIRHLVVGGGVVANSRLREKLFRETKDKGINTYFPSKELCMDNAAMVAGLGYQLFRKGLSSDLSLNADSS
jgi:N6-L-threonylcarbamoyladenine synthase